MAFCKDTVVAGCCDQRFPLLINAVAQIERQMHIDVEEARDIFCTLDIATQPKHGISHATQHGKGTLCDYWDERSMKSKSGILPINVTRLRQQVRENGDAGLPHR